MILRPQAQDLKIIGFFLGKLIVAIGLIELIPIFIAILFSEWAPLIDFIIGASSCFLVGNLLIFICNTDKDPNWVQGMVVVSCAWLAAMFAGAIPLYLSGHFGSFLDACFDAMSGFATTGLTLIKDLDHLSFTHNFWRHLMIFAGGQGIVIIALTFLVRGLPGALRVYVGEAREEKILPNVIQTARFIWTVSIVYLLLGTAATSSILYTEGLSLGRSLFHGLCIFMAAFDTGGFAPQSQNILYYHSLWLEVATVAMMLTGAINFKLHYALWTGARREIRRNIEIATFFISVVLLYLLVALGLRNQAFAEGWLAMFRRGFYQLISSHTGTGYTNVYSRQFIVGWGPLAFLGIIIAMSLGGGACSTTGGIKNLRIGLIFKAISQDIKRLILPESTVVSQRFHHIEDLTLEERQVRSATLITLSYIFLYLLGAIIGAGLGYPFSEALFESISAAANVGLSCGITSPSMPAGLKLTYIFQMWVGRLEFMSIFALIGFIIASVKGR
jgi:trk system potassium uptake protein TrkH